MSTWGTKDEWIQVFLVLNFSVDLFYPQMGVGK